MKYFVLPFALLLTACGATPDATETVGATTTDLAPAESAAASSSVDAPTSTQAETETAPTPQVVPAVADKTVVIAEYFDFDCGYCRLASERMAELRAANPDTLQVELRHFVVHPAAETAHRGAACADEQDALQQFHDVWFADYYGRNSAENTKKAAAQINLDAAAFAACLASERPDEAIKRDGALARKAGARGTPYFVIDETIPVPGLISSEQFQQVINRQLSQ